jgi:hypothetical protein
MTVEQFLASHSDKNTGKAALSVSPRVDRAGHIEFHGLVEWDTGLSLVTWLTRGPTLQKVLTSLGRVITKYPMGYSERGFQ